MAPHISWSARIIYTIRIALGGIVLFLVLGGFLFCSFGPTQYCHDSYLSFITYSAYAAEIAEQQPAQAPESLSSEQAQFQWAHILGSAVVMGALGAWSLWFNKTK
jgi:hypothetical protein